MFLDNVVTVTERFLTWRKRRIMRKKKKQAMKSVARDWVEAFFWAAGVVLLINQYLFQAYMIPSPSMEDTLLVGDRIFVNKVVFGPEVLPAFGKLNGIKKPAHGEVIIFENPDYLSKGTAFDIAQRVIYMLTLSFVDIDTEINPRTGKREPRHHFLIKRNIGTPGDRVRLINGNVQLMPEGFDNWISEEEYKTVSGLVYPDHRIFSDNGYDYLKQNASRLALETTGITAEFPHFKGAQPGVVWDDYSRAYYFSKERHAINPSSESEAEYYYRGDMGFYIKEGWILPLGDNRDDSKDGRYFGLVSYKKVLGEAEIKYWPPGRIGVIR